MFHTLLDQIYEELGKPQVRRDNIWNIYMALLERVEALQRTDRLTIDQMGLAAYNEDIHEDDEHMVALLSAEIQELQPLQEVVEDGYAGGVNGGLGPGRGDSNVGEYLMGDTTAIQEEHFHDLDIDYFTSDDEDDEEAQVARTLMTYIDDE